jgi:hypothetical protein
MPIRVAINGFGRIGRNVLRSAKRSGAKNVDFVAVNDLTDNTMLAPGGCANKVGSTPSMRFPFPFDSRVRRRGTRPPVHIWSTSAGGARVGERSAASKRETHR